MNILFILIITPTKNDDELFSLLVFFSSLLVYLCNGQICTSPVYNNSGVIIKGPCPSVAPVGSAVLFECSYSYTEVHLTFWNITDIGIVVNLSIPPNSGIVVIVNVSSGNGIAILSLSLTKQNSLSEDLVHHLQL